MDENKILLKFNSLNTYPIGYTYCHKIEGTKYSVYLIPKWMPGNDNDIWVHSTKMKSELSKIGLTCQLYYDIMKLRISSIDQRPKCLSDICNNEVKFCNLSRGYLLTCSRSCKSRVCDLRPEKNRVLRSTFTISRKGSKNSKSHNDKVSQSMKGRKVSEESKLKISSTMLKKYEDPNEILKRIRTNKPSKTRKGWISVSKCKEDIYYGSSWEKFLIEYCESSSEVKEIFRCNVIKYEFEGKSKRYLPDLMVSLIDGKSIIFEVKPSHELENDKVKAKEKYARIYCESLVDTEYRFFTEKDIKRIKSGENYKFIN